MIYINLHRKITALFTVAALAFLTILPATPVSAARKDFSGIKIVIDPGHGGHDSGAIGPAGLTESSTNLSIAKYLRNYLKHAGAKVIMTRDTDRFIPLPERANIANRAKADRFISVHLNSSENSSANRTETYFHKPFAAKMAARVQRKMVRDLKFANGGNLTANFAVIRRTNMPGILTEAAFISNPRVEAKLKTASFKQKIAAAIYKGIKSDYGVKAPKLSKKRVKKQNPIPVVKQVLKSKRAVVNTHTEAPAVNNKQGKGFFVRTVESVFGDILPRVEKKAPEVKPAIKIKTKSAAKKSEVEKQIKEKTKEKKHRKLLKLEVKNTPVLPFLNPVTKAGNATKLETSVVTPAFTKPVVIKNSSNKSIQPQVKLYNTAGKKVADIKPVLLKHKGLKIRLSNLARNSEFTGRMQITAPNAQIVTSDTATIMP